MTDKIDIILKGFPPEVNNFFLEDLAEIVPLMQDDNDEALVDATKQIIETYLRTDICNAEYDGLFMGVQMGYIEEKPDFDKTFFEKVEKLYNSAKKLRMNINEKTENYFK